MKLFQDKEIWNRQMLLAMLVCCVAAFHIDLYTSSVPELLKQWGEPESIVGLAITFAIASQLIGNVIGGYLIDRHGVKRVQYGCLSVMLLTSLLSSFAESSQQILAAQLIRYAAGDIIVSTVKVQWRSWLPRNKHVSGVIKLNSPMLGVAAITAFVGPWMVGETLMPIWKWAPPILAAMAFVVVWQVPDVPKPGKSSLFQSDVFKLWLPQAGIGICTGAFLTHLVNDVSKVEISSFRFGMYVIPAVVGWWCIPKLIGLLDKQGKSEPRLEEKRQGTPDLGEKDLSQVLNHQIQGEKRFIRLGVLLMAGAMLLFRWPNLIGLLVAVFIISLFTNGVRQVLESRAHVMTEQTGLAASLGPLVYRGNMLIGSFGFGLLLEVMQQDQDSWLILAPLMASSLALYEWSFRTNRGWTG